MSEANNALAESVPETSASSQPEPEDAKSEHQRLEDAQSSPEKISLTAAQRAHIERKRQKALLIKQAKQNARPYKYASPEKVERQKRTAKVVDTGGGFLLEETEEEESQKVTHKAGAVIGPGTLMCHECDKEFLESYLHSTFEYSVCDNCRDSDDKHRVITKTEAKDSYLLKDVDLDKREPILKYLLKKNPHNPRWGDMKLYLECQVVERAEEVWGTEEKMEEYRAQKIVNKEKSKQKKFDKKVKEMRLAVRSTLWTKDLKGHEHTYGKETCVDEDEDLYSKTCTDCGHVMTYEKM